MELIAALIAATVAISVVIVDRRLAAREERQRWEAADRRTVYARFAAAAFGLMEVELNRSSGRYTPSTETVLLPEHREMVKAWSELRIVASAVVEKPASDLAVALLQATSPTRSAVSYDSIGRLHNRYIAAARRDLGYPVDEEWLANDSPPPSDSPSKC